MYETTTAITNATYIYFHLHSEVESGQAWGFSKIYKGTPVVFLFAPHFDPSPFPEREGQNK